jgi:hypothetical protein
MKKHFTIKLISKSVRFALAAVLSINSALNADGQVLWGAGSSESSSDEAGRFAKEFGDSTSWNSRLDDSKTYWSRTTTGVSQGFGWNGGEVFKSPGLSDGAAIFDSDYFFLREGFRDPHRGELISPVIDLTGLKPGDPIDIKLFLYYRIYRADDFSVGFSSDNGKTWKDYQFNLSGNNPDVAYGQSYRSFRMTDATKGVTNFSKCRLRLVFQGSRYFVMVDNISIERGIEYDIAFPYYGHFGNHSTINPSPYSQIPLRYGVKASDKNFIYGAAIVNYGGLPIPASANPELTCELLKSSGNSWNSLFKKVISIGRNIPYTDSIRVKGDLTAEFNSAISENGTGKYKFTYRLSHNLKDGDTTNNERTHEFTVTEDFGTWYSSVPLNQDGNPSTNIVVYPPTDFSYTYEQGVYFYFPDQQDLAIATVKYSAFIPEKLYGKTPVSIKIYSVTNIDDPGGFSLKATGVDTLNISAVDENKTFYREVIVRDIVEKKPGFKLNNTSGLYAVAVSQYHLDGINYDEAMGTVNSVLPGGYLYPVTLGQAISRNYYMYLAIGEGSTPNKEKINYYSGYGSDYDPFVPSIALKMINSEFMGISEPAYSSDAGTVTLYPNPVTDHLNLDVNLKMQSNEASFILTDANGMVINLEKFNQVQKMQYSLSTANLAPGTYIIHVKTDTGNIANKFIKY